MEIFLFFGLLIILIFCILYVIFEQEKTEKQNTLVIVLDEMIPWHNLPNELTDKLQGYQAFKKNGLEFTNIHNNRQPCSPSRSTLFTSQINTGIQDDIQESYQFQYVPYISQNAETIGKIYQKEGYITAYRGKNHMDARLTQAYSSVPYFVLNTEGAMRSYGFDTFNILGDTALTIGFNGDNREFEYIQAPNSEQYDFIENGWKLSGILPFLKARKKDKKPFHAQFHLINPHDTMQFYQNTSQIPKGLQVQYNMPFLEEQSEQIGYKNPYIYNSDFMDAYVKSKNLTSNFFEQNFKDYNNNFESMPFKDSYKNGYVTNTDQIFPWFVGTQQTLEQLFSIANSQDDLQSWKNLINNYYGLIIQADMYIFKIYQYLEQNNMLDNTSVIITSDHGDEMSSHGLKQKGFPFNNSVNVCCLISSKNLKQKGKSNVLGSLLDINPTLENLSNLDSSSSFLGKSLIKSGYSRDENVDVINVMCSTMYFIPTYYGWKKWYSQQNEETKLKCVNVPKNMFEYQYIYLMVITYHEGVKYKFCRFFNLFEMYNYNLKDTVIKNENFDFLPSEFTFEEGFKLIENEDSDNLIKFMLFINKFYNSKKSNVYNLPGSNENYLTLKNNKNYSFMCWNMDDDPSETNNLISTASDDLLSLLNRKINLCIIKYEMTNFVFISPLNSPEGMFGLISQSLVTQSNKNVQTNLFGNYGGV